LFIKRTKRTLRGKTYTNHLLVESVATERGPRHRVVCSLGSLAPAPKAQWLKLAHHLQECLGGQESLLEHSAQEQALVQKATLVTKGKKKRNAGGDININLEEVEVEEARQAGAVHVGHQIWQRLGLDEILAEAGFGHNTRLLTQVMTLNRLIEPCSELAMSQWVGRSALGDLLKEEFSELNEDRLYRNMDRLYGKRGPIEAALSAKEKSLFSLKDSILLYDLTSTYFEGLCLANPKAKRGYSRDSRPDCKQVVVGLVLDGEGFPKAHEIFAGNRSDSTTVADMLAILQKRVGKTKDATVVVDRGMANPENLATIQAAGYHWLVAAPQPERVCYFEQFEEQEGWQEIVREPSPRNEGQQKVRVLIKPAQSPDGSQSIALCWSEGRTQKDRAIRQKQEVRFLADTEKLAKRIALGRLRTAAKIYEAIGRLKERYPRVARYYHMAYEEQKSELSCREDLQRKQKAESLDGSYLLKSSRSDLRTEDIWRTYVLLTRVEAAFRAMKSPLCERPIFHHLERRVETHIFLCVLAYHLLVCIERAFLEQGIHTSWETLRSQLSTHQVVTVRLPTTDGRTLTIRRDTRPEQIHRDIYRVLRVPERILSPIKRWTQNSH
jgi:transposase